MLNRSNNIKSVLVRSYSSFVQPGKFNVEHNETIANRLKNACNTFGYYDALSIPDHENYTLTYDEMLHNVKGLANGFAEHNIKKDQVVVSNSEGINNTLTYLGATTAGLTYVTLPASSTFSEIGAHLQKKKANSLIMGDMENNMVEGALEFFPNLNRSEYFRDERYPQLKHIFSMANKDEPGISLLKDIILDSKDFPYGDLSNNQVSVSYPINDQYVSFTQKSVLNTADALGEFFDIKPRQRFSLAIPSTESLSTIFNLACLLRGAFVAQISNINPTTIINTITQDKCEVLLISGSNFNTLVNSTEFSKVESLKLNKLVIVGEYDASLLKQFESKCKTQTFNIPVNSNQILGFAVSSSNVKLLPNVEAKVVGGVLKTKGYHVSNGEWLDTKIKATLEKDGSIKL
ncbi:hypothetical protein DICPUDRAFT_89646 [Dictyostelium purpureum]|uniref:AMP-dependent synthetase/ligase domain-containing protein n=1 Tax=Dictyostelium purpureum TaxID=5786 RepID=F0ZX81_DICPU|nr:uncharacterized protein DICPUDRAFT_89646 [Dictyostelium purpureum]EGC31451.1 hypothetical protein DICPUDRAFT_89646 [Dictyostelium purpureum]|eukprot:XP_003292020.1 hypothetical protein DICPUDRAFT_89646 [Dictyostelium purpureum]